MDSGEWQKLGEECRMTQKRRQTHLARQHSACSRLHGVLFINQRHMPGPTWARIAIVVRYRAVVLMFDLRFRGGHAGERGTRQICGLSRPGCLLTLIPYMIGWIVVNGKYSGLNMILHSGGTIAASSSACTSSSSSIGPTSSNTAPSSNFVNADAQSGCSSR